MSSKVEIVVEGLEWADAYCDFCQPIYEKAYAAPERGIPKELFSKTEFDDISTRDYFRRLFRDDLVWLALENGKIIGGVAASLTDPVHMSAFYVDNNRQGGGVGSQLFAKVLAFAEERDIILDVMRHRTQSIDIYKHWGFVVDETKPPIYYGWPYPTPEGRENGAGVTMIRKHEA